MYLQQCIEHIYGYLLYTLWCFCAHWWLSFWNKTFLVLYSFGMISMINSFEAPWANIFSHYMYTGMELCHIKRQYPDCSFFFITCNICYWSVSWSPTKVSLITICVKSALTYNIIIPGSYDKDCRVQGGDIQSKN